jgi:hypothetical protein
LILRVQLIVLSHPSPDYISELKYLERSSTEACELLGTAGSQHHIDTSAILPTINANNSIMSDSESKPKGGVPSWQMKPEASDPKPATEEKPASSSSSSPEVKPRTSVLEDARKFLEEEEVKDASTDKKVAFLEGKGLTSEEIHQLLGITRNLEATSLESQVRLLIPKPETTQLTQHRPHPKPKHHPPNPSQPPHPPLHNLKHPTPRHPLNPTATPPP